MLIDNPTVQKIGLTKIGYNFQSTMATPLAVAGEAMETLKMKIFMLKKENNEVTEKMEEAEKVGIASFLL